MNQNELSALAALARYEKLNPHLPRLIAHFETPTALFKARADELVAAGLTMNVAWSFVRERVSLNGDRELALTARHGIELIPFDDPRYPPLLATADGAPTQLFVRGNVAALSAVPALACVGTRRLTRYGMAAADILLRPFAAAGGVIVSGLALGCDAYCHEISLNARATTVAVLGGGIDPTSIGPRTNARLAERIVESGGALVAEYPVGAIGTKFHFPERNRIIAGMTLGTLVIEAAEKSGSLITAFCALNADRDVWAVPGPINAPMAGGGNRLLSKGALPALASEDLLERYGLAARCQLPAARSSTESAILAALGHGPLDLDALAIKTGLDIADLLTKLTTLELDGRLTCRQGIYSVI